ncbi:MAG TPA: tyrosine-type recombinase/integrase, partial [Anaerolineae bacterium]|nr:tyrosine-type recombinase/integrase [Anaerolineae bacterium]
KVHTWLSAKQVRALMATCGDDIVGLRDRVVLGLLVGAGLRRAELAALTWDAIEQQPVGDKMRTVLEIHGKGGRDRVVPISATLAALLDGWAGVTGRTGRIVRSLGRGKRLGDSLSTIGIFDVVRRHGKAIGCPGLAPHDLRRSFAHLGYDAGVDIGQLSVLLGHSSISTTQRYLDLSLDLEVTASDFVPV